MGSSHLKSTTKKDSLKQTTEEHKTAFLVTALKGHRFVFRGRNPRPNMERCFFFFFRQPKARNSARSVRACTRSNVPMSLVLRSEPLCSVSGTYYYFEVTSGILPADAVDISTEELNS